MEPNDNTKKPTPPRLLEAVEAVKCNLSKEKEWKSETLMVDFAKSFDSDEVQQINIIDHIGFDTRLTAAKKNSMRKFWLPPKFNRNDENGRKDVQAHFSNACLADGFGLRMKEYNSQRQALRLQCHRGRYYAENKSKTDDINTTKPKAYPNRVATTRKAVKGETETCPFTFLVLWNQDFKRWYLPETQAGSAHHSGHMKVTRDIAPARKDDLPADELKLLNDCIDSKMKTSSLDKLIMKRNNMSLTRGKLDYLKSVQKEIQSNRGMSGQIRAGKMLHPQTPADRLLAHFDEDDKASYVALYAEFDSENITIRKKCKYRQDHSIDDVDPNSCSDDVTSAISDAEKHRRSILKNLVVSSEVNKILLAFAWTDDESKLRFDMFPEVMGGDCVSKMNRENRQVMHWTGLDSNNQAFTHTWVFLPSEAHWTFEWVVTNVIPHLHNRETLEKVQIVLTDQDGQLNDVVTKNTGPGSVFPNAKHRLCAWHKLDRNLTNKSSFSSLLVSKPMKLPTCRAEWNAIVSWLWQMCRMPETENESNFLLTLLQCYLEEDPNNHRGFLSTSLHKKLAHFISKSFQFRQSKFFAHYFFDKMGVDKITTAHVEAENSAAKRHAYAPGPRDSLDQAQLKMEQRTEQRNRSRRQKAAEGQVSLPASQEDRNKTVTELTKYASDFLWAQHNQGHKYHCWSVSRTECYVKRKPTLESISDEYEGMAYDVMQSVRKKYVVPSLERTRVVTMEWDELAHQFIIKCSCGTFNNMGMTCRHVMAVTGQQPTKMDARYRWWRDYNLLFLGSSVSEETRRDIVKADSISRQNSGTPTHLQEFPRHSSDMPRDWFTSTVGTFEIRKVGYWSTETGKDLIELAKIRVKAGAVPFGTIQETHTSGTGPFGLDGLESDTDGSDTDDEDNDKTSHDHTQDEKPSHDHTQVDTCVTEMLLPIPNLDKHLTDEAVNGMLRKGAYSSLHSLYSDMSKLANNSERMTMMWKCMQHTHQMLLDNIRQNESPSRRGTMASDPNVSGRKRSNARTKRVQDKHTKRKKKS